MQKHTFPRGAPPPPPRRLSDPPERLDMPCPHPLGRWGAWGGPAERAVDLMEISKTAQIWGAAVLQEGGLYRRGALSAYCTYGALVFARVLLRPLLRPSQPVVPRWQGGGVLWGLR